MSETTQAETPALPTITQVIEWAQQEDVPLTPGQAREVRDALTPGENYRERVEAIISDEDELAELIDGVRETPSTVRGDGELELDQFDHVAPLIGDEIDPDIWSRAQEILRDQGHEFVHLCSLDTWAYAYADAEQEAQSRKNKKSKK